MKVEFSLRAFRNQQTKEVNFREYVHVIQGESSGLERPREQVLDEIVDESIVKSFPEQYAAFQALLADKGQEIRDGLIAELDKADGFSEPIELVEEVKADPVEEESVIE